ncbi:ANTAR domain-containing protein [Paractinoplanes maris]|uniref:ANTAR domain-containing protein n=1 Tax=Paractinoplanes maris TaxID=1734446 RepID=UPI00202187BC|nr:ANTAR domain-containing protein [Actinoplanes maris]
MTDDKPVDPADAFAELGRIKLSEIDLQGVLRKIADLAKRTVPGAAEVTVTLVQGERAQTAAFTGDVALALDETQYRLGHGPCLEASAGAGTLSLPDMARESRWPDFARRALDAGVHSSLSVGLPVHADVTGALNVYATRAAAFDNTAVELAEVFSGYAAVTLGNAHLYDAKATLAQQMQAAMQSRAVIEQAKGILMGGRHCSAEEAFKILTKLSQDTNRKLRDVAAALVDSVQHRGQA